MENNNNTLLKVGEDIIFASHGIDYKMSSGKVYTVEVDRYTYDIKMHEAPALELPQKMYVLPDDKKFTDKVLTRYKTFEGMTGVMMAGEKGTGKTVLTKYIAMQSKLPILLLDKSFNPSLFKKLFNKLADMEVCIIFDEIDKLGERYDSDYMLQVFDGISASGHHLMLSTCNNTDDVNEYLLDRCGRIRYYKEFEEMGPTMIQTILKDHLDDKKKVNTVTEFIIKHFGLISFDNIVAFADEVNMYANAPLESLFKDMNISEK